MFIIHGYADQSFLDEVLKKEELSSTVINEKAAVLNPLKHHCTQSRIGVLILDQPILWAENEVQIVFILSLTNEDQKDLGMILHEISEMTAHKYTFDEILNCRDYEIFLEIVRENL